MFQVVERNWSDHQVVSSRSRGCETIQEAAQIADDHQNDPGDDTYITVVDDEGQAVKWRHCVPSLA